MLVAGTLSVGISMIVAWIVAVHKVDSYWRPQRQQCCRCLKIWRSREKFCPLCRGSGRLARKGIIPPHRVPTHDWQGSLDTQPIGKVVEWYQPSLEERVRDAGS